MRPRAFRPSLSHRQAIGEAALSDIILLGAEQQVRLAQRAAVELVAGHPVQAHDLVVSLRDFIREALQPDPIPKDIVILTQGATRPGSAGGGGGKGMGGRMGRAGVSTVPNRHVTVPDDPKTSIHTHNRVEIPPSKSHNL